MADPLSLLRQFNVNKKDIMRRLTIIFDEYSWPKTVKTNYLVGVKRTAEEPQNEVVKKPRLEETQMRAKEQFSARLDAPKEAPVVTEQIRSLSEALSVEKIAAIKAKRLARSEPPLKRR
ncbi:hypothetical protein HPB49_026211 [Dermacentor silvarum]|nr:hypothetical protein HPB49_026211 [Dermacentor silvarum]